MEIDSPITFIVLLVSVLVFILSIYTSLKLRGSNLIWSSVFFGVTALMFVFHALVEVVDLGTEIYAITALIASMLFVLNTLVFDKNVKKIEGIN